MSKKIMCCIFLFCIFSFVFCNGVYVRTLCSEEQTQISDPPAPGHWAQLDMSPCTQCLLGENSLKCHKIYEKGHKEVKNVTALKMFSGVPKLILFSFLFFFWSYSSSWSWQLPQSQDHFKGKFHADWFGRRRSQGDPSSRFLRDF